MRRHKIALVTDKYLPIFGGLEIFLHDLAHELIRRGHEVQIICVTPGQPDDDDENDDGGERFPVHRLDVPRIPFLYRSRSPIALRKLHAVLTAERFDLIHGHCIFSPLAHAATYLAQRLGVPSVFTLHSVLRGAGALALSALDKVCPWSQWPTVLCGVSSHVAKELRAVSRRDVQVVLNAAHISDWQRERREELRIVSAMRFTRRKRPIDLVRLAPSILARLPRALWPKFTLIGDGPERAAVEREIARLGLAGHFELPGYLPRAAMAQLFARSAVFAVPCQREALSIAAIEARAAGLPVVARIPSGVSEVIEHGTHGYLARTDHEFVAGLVKLLAAPGLRARMSDAARKDLERFTWPRCIERHEEIYDLALHARRPTSIPEIDHAVHA